MRWKSQIGKAAGDANPEASWNQVLVSCLVYMQFNAH
jgi:hypothetical protein